MLVCIVGLKKHRSWQKMSSTYLTKPMQKTRWQSRTKPQWIAVKWRIYLTPSALWTNGSILFRCFGKLQESITKALSFPQDESAGSGLAKSVSIQSHRIHVKGIFTYIWLIFMVNVGKYASHMDPMGVDDSRKQMSCESCCFNLFPKNSWWLIPLPIHPSIYRKTIENLYNPSRVAVIAKQMTWSGTVEAFKTNLANEKPRENTGTYLHS